MNITVTVKIVANEQFALQIEPPSQDPQLQLLHVPSIPTVEAPDAAVGSFAMPTIEEAVPISYGVPRQTGLVPA